MVDFSTYSPRELCGEIDGMKVQHKGAKYSRLEKVNMGQG